MHAEVEPSINDDEAKTTRQAALSKAMGTLFLQHRVVTLEADVDGLSFHRTASPSSSYGPSREPSNSTSLPCKEMYVVDASVLIYSLRSVHDWLKRGDVCVLVPQEVLYTLDVLKKGEHTLNLAARKATRFLEERLLTRTTSREYGGLVAQRDGERCSLDEAERLRAACSATRLAASSSSSPDSLGVAELSSSATSSLSTRSLAPSSSTRRSYDSERSSTFSSPPPLTSSLPLSLPATLRLAHAATRELLLCALHFPTARLAVAHPPPHLSTTNVAPHSDDGPRQDLSLPPSRQSPPYLERVDGAVVESLARAYGVSVMRCKTADSWIQLGRTTQGAVGTSRSSVASDKQRKHSGEERRRA